MPTVKKVLRWVLYIALLVFLFIFLLVMPFQEKGVIHVDKEKGITLGNTIGANLRNYFDYWVEFLRDIIEGITNPPPKQPKNP